MKKVFLFVVVSVLHFAARSQPNPPYLNTVYYWAAADSLLMLEKTNGEIRNKFRYFGGGSGPNLVLDGPHSSVRLKSGDGTRFVVKLSGMMDPSSLIKLYRLDPQKKSRETTMSQGSRNVVDCNVQKSGADVSIFIPTVRLAPGEYGFQNTMMMNGAGTTQMSYTFFAFGVDQ
jgi:hypothetical protein